MTNKNRRYLRMRNENIEGGGLTAHYWDKKNKQVVFHIKGGFPTKMAIPMQMKRFPSGYIGVGVRCVETFYKL